MGKIDKALSDFIVTGEKKIHLRDFDPDWHGMGKKLSREEAKDAAEHMKCVDLPRMAELQDVLYASNRYSLLLIFQAMDAAGKDGTIRHVMSGVNPQGCQVFSFKQPSQEELDHDFLWRTTKALPERGRIGIFNRSYYEDVLVVKVHPELLSAQQLPDADNSKRFWQGRYKSIRNFEDHLTRNGTRVLKFFLNVSKEEQLKRFLARLTNPEKNWKFGASDLSERAYWKQYMAAYEDAINETSTRDCPWFVIPADNKEVMRALVAKIIIRAMENLDLNYPVVSEAAKKRNAEAKVALDAEMAASSKKKR